VEHDVHADVGFAHLSVPRLELVVRPGGKHSNIDRASGGSVEGEAAAPASSPPPDPTRTIPAGHPAVGSAFLGSQPNQHLPAYLLAGWNGGVHRSSSSSSSSSSRSILKQRSAAGEEAPAVSSGSRYDTGTGKSDMTNFKTHLASLSITALGKSW
jgi:hypothetical protein